MTLARLVEHLVAALEAQDPAGVHRPLTVAELRARALPYRVYRGALGLTNSEDYELLILRLVAEEDGWVRTLPEEARDRARREVASPNPDVDLAAALGSATVQIGAPALARLKERRDAAASATAAPSLTAEAGEADILDELEADPIAPPALPPQPLPPPAPIPVFDSLDGLEEPALVIEPPPPMKICNACGGSLPTGRSVVFCPDCGTQVGALQCVRCGAELESGWRHCVLCGHRAAHRDGRSA